VAIASNVVLAMVVLVVDDSSTIRQLLQLALARIAGTVIVEACDGLDALAKLAEIAPDVVLTDLDMPNLDGLSLIRRLRERPSSAHLPVVVLTTQRTMPPPEVLEALSITACIVKPIRPDEVVETVRAVVPSRR
jgi:two-component system chemotaxis response regulator CheY